MNMSCIPYFLRFLLHSNSNLSNIRKKISEHSINSTTAQKIYLPNNTKFIFLACTNQYYQIQNNGCLLLPVSCMNIIGSAGWNSFNHIGSDSLNAKWQTGYDGTSYINAFTSSSDIYLRIVFLS